MINKQIDDLRNNTQILKASIISSFISTIITNPLEVMKLNLQFFPLSCKSYPHTSYRQLVFCSCMKFSLKGSVASLKIALPQTIVNNIIFMQLYQQLRDSILKTYQCNTALATFGASIMGRIVVTSLNIPFQSLRIRLSNEVVNHKLNLHGYKITIVRDIIYSGMYWSLLQAYRNNEIKGQYRQKIKYEDDFTRRNFLINLLPALAFGALVSIVTTPLDTVKTRIQSQGITRYKIIQSIMKIYRKQGYLGLFYGAEWRALKNGVHSSLYLFMYEWYLQRISSDDIMCKLKQ